MRCLMFAHSWELRTVDQIERSMRDEIGIHGPKDVSQLELPGKAVTPNIQ
jgi:hypothetical protein